MYITPFDLMVRLWLEALYLPYRFIGAQAAAPAADEQVEV